MIFSYNFLKPNFQRVSIYFEIIIKIFHLQEHSAIVLLMDLQGYSGTVSIYTYSIDIKTQPEMTMDSFML